MTNTKKITIRKTNPHNWLIFVDGVYQGDIVKHTMNGRVSGYNVAAWNLDDQETFFSRLHGGPRGAFKAAQDFVNQHFA